MPNRVTRTSTTTRGALHGCGRALFAVHGHGVGEPRSGDDLGVGFHGHVEHVDPVRLEVLTLVVDGDLQHVLVLVVVNVDRRGGRGIQIVATLRAGDFGPALRGVGDPEDLHAVSLEGQLGALNPIGVGDHRLGAIGDLGPGDHDVPANTFRIAAGEPAALLDVRGKFGVVADALLSVGKRNIDLDVAADGEDELVGLGDFDHLGAHPQ